MYCQDGMPEPWRETDEKRQANPGATTQKFWDACIQHIDKRVTVNLVEFSFRSDDRAAAKAWLTHADLFYIRGTGFDKETKENTFEQLVDIVDDPSCADLVLALQYEVLENKIIYVGVCGAAKLAGESVSMPEKGGTRKGLQLFGKGVTIQYDGWRDDTINDNRVIQINEVNFSIVDTLQGKADCAVMCNNKKHSYADKQQYLAKAKRIQQNLQGVLAALECKIDYWTCALTMRVFAMQVHSGRTWYVQPEPLD